MKDKKDRLYSNGESLSESLIAALIISFAMIMLFTCAKVGTDIMKKARAGYQSYYNEINEYEESQATYVSKYYDSLTEETDPRPDPYEFQMEPHKYNW